ncbi:MAG: cyclophilin-like fold protein [Verrucomicrobiae bacterium]|nr:cyclophilin-like fold protein [Verrucomicrobiae bacterium]
MTTTRNIRITVGNVCLAAELNASRTAEAILRALPIEASGQRWGDEIYFRIPVVAEPEDPREVVAIGDLAYWPPGRAFCIFFGPTPVSCGDEIRPASAVNVVGKVTGDATVLRPTRDGETVRIEPA